MGKIIYFKKKDMPEWDYVYIASRQKNIIYAGIPDTPEGMLRAGAFAVEMAKTHKADKLIMSIKTRYSRFLSEGVVHGLYSYNEFKKQPSVPEVVFPYTDKNISYGMTIGRFTNYARDLINRPANILNSDALVEEAKKLKKVKVIIRDEKWLLKNNMNLILSVNAGSNNPAKLIELEFGSGKEHLAFVGKGVTYDSGGYSIKPTEFMEWMKADMGGAAVVLALFKAVSTLNLPVTIKGYIPCVENMVDSKATRVGDIIRSHKGLSVEVMNTDAEGRLILADAMSYACLKKPSKLFTIATLTGAALIALGHTHSAVIGDDDICRELVLSGERAVDYCWQLPLVNEHRLQFESEIADLRNVGKDKRLAGCQQGAAFLSYFVKDTRWAHIDIAGTAFQKTKPLEQPNWKRSGANAGSLRMLIEYLKQSR